MARKVEEQCMFCGMSPCECPGTLKPKKATKPKAKVAAKVVEKKEPVQRSNESSSDEDIFGDIPARQSKFKASAKVRERDWELESALHALRPICSPKSQNEIDKVLNAPYPPALDRRVVEFKRRQT